MVKWVLFTLLLICASMTNVLADYPDLKGTWHADSGDIYIVGDTIEESTAGINDWVIEEQSDKVIMGSKSFLTGEEIINQTFVGVFDSEGKSLYFLDQQGGLSFGTLTDPDTLSITLLNPGSMKEDGEMMVILTLKRT